VKVAVEPTDTFTLTAGSLSPARRLALLRSGADVEAGTVNTGDLLRCEHARPDAQVINVRRAGIGAVAAAADQV